jgi:hypothetical protein
VRHNVPGKRILEEGWWLVDFRMKYNFMFEGDQGMGMLIKPWFQRVPIGRESGRKRVRV